MLRSLLWAVLLCFSYSSIKAECTSETLGLCTSGTEEVIVETIIEDSNSSSVGTTTITTTTTDITTTTIINQDSGNLLDGANDYVTTTKEGDMDSDWGGQGPATMPSGKSCYELGTDKCAMITGSGNTTSTMGVEGMGSTFIQTIDISDLTIDNGGNTQYTIKVDKQDPQDRIYMNITGRNGNTEVFTGTDILSESGITSGYQQYSGSFDFSGVLNTIIVEVGGRDINLAIGPLFDDVSINVFYNVVNTIVSQQITTVEMFIALNNDTTEEIINVVETIFELNEPIDEPDYFNFEPLDKPMNEFSYESVETEMQEFEMDFQMDMDINMEYDMPDIVMIPTNIDMDMEVPMEITVASVEMDIEMEIDFPDIDMPKPEPQQMEIDIEPTTEEPTMDMPEAMEEEPVMETNMDSEPEQMEEQQQEPEQEVEPEVKEEPQQEPEPEVEKEVEEPKQEIKKEPKKEPTAKQKAATKIVKNMGDKGRYEDSNQLKTLIVMQVLGNTKSFFDTQMQLQDTVGFFTDVTLPDTQIQDNNLANYYMIVDSNNAFNNILNSQYQ